MDSTIIVATIGGVAAVAAAGVGLLKKKSDETGGSVSVRSVSASKANVAIGSNITQTYQGTAHNYYGAPAVEGPFQGKVASKPSPVDVVSAIGAIKVPYDQIQVAKNYVGLRVSWPVIFRDVNISEDGWRVSFDVPYLDYRKVFVSANIDIEKYPRLKIATSGQRVWVEGQIRAADWIFVGLEPDPEIWFE